MEALNGHYPTCAGTGDKQHQYKYIRKIISNQPGEIENYEDQCQTSVRCNLNNNHPKQLQHGHHLVNYEDLELGALLGHRPGRQQQQAWAREDDEK